MAEPTPIEMLKSDHERVEEMFQRFHATDDNDEKKDIAQKIFEDLRVHAHVEEAVFYPEVAKVSPEGEIMIASSIKDHQVIKDLISDMENLDPSDPIFKENFDTLVSVTRSHIVFEEGEVFPFAEGFIADEMGAGMSARMIAHKSKERVKEII